jgi:heme a synthase
MRQLTPARYRQLTLLALVVVCVLVATGALVRLTGSGLGCENWPECSDTKLVDVSSGHAAIEQLNRILTGIGSFIVIGAVLAARRRSPRRRDLTRLSWFVVAGFFGQIPLGGITVLTDLHPVAVQAHFLLSMVLCALAFVLWRRSGWPDDQDPRVHVSPRTRGHVRLIAILTALAVAAGTVVTGTGPHSGEIDEDTGLPKSERFPFSITSVARVHSITVLALIAAVVALMWWLRAHADRAAIWPQLQRWLFAGLFQGLLGYVQYANGTPVPLVAIHVALAVVVWLNTVDLVETTRW